MIYLYHNLSKCTKNIQPVIKYILLNTETIKLVLCLSYVFILFIYTDVQPDLFRAMHAGTDPVDVLQFD